MHCIRLSLLLAWAIQAASFGQMLARAPMTKRVQAAVNRPAFHFPVSSMSATHSKRPGFSSPFLEYRSPRTAPHAMPAILQEKSEEKQEVLAWNSGEMSSLLAELEQKMAILVAEAADAKLQVEAAKIQADAAKLAAPTINERAGPESEAIAMADAAVERAEAAAVATEEKVQLAAQAVVQAAEAAAGAEASVSVHAAAVAATAATASVRAQEAAAATIRQEAAEASTSAGKGIKSAEEAAAAAEMDEEAATATEADIQEKATYLRGTVKAMGAIFPGKKISARAEIPWHWHNEPLYEEDFPLYGGGIRQSDGSVLYNFHDSLDEVQTTSSISTTAALMIGLLAGSGVTFAALFFRRSRT